MKMRMKRYCTEAMYKPARHVHKGINMGINKNRRMEEETDEGTVSSLNRRR